MNGIEKHCCECCSETTYYVPLDNDSLTCTDEGEIQLVLSRDEMQDLYLSFKDELLHNN